MIGVSVSDNSDNTGDGYSAVELHLDGDVVVPLYDNSYTIIRTFWAKDHCGNRVEAHRTITVVDTTPPCFDEMPEDTTVECDAVPEPCEVFTVGENLHVDFFESKSESSYGFSKIIRKWKACDKSGNCNAFDQTITVEDTTPPIFTRVPRDTTLPCDCESFPGMANLAAIDNCDDFVTVQHTEQEIEIDCPDTYKLVRRWIAVDHAGETTTHAQTISIVDNIPPTIVGHPVDSTIQCDDLFISNLPKVTAYDNCADDVQVNHHAVEKADMCTVRRHYTFWAYDDCGGYDWAVWDLVVEDSDGPTVYGGKHCIYARTNDGYGSDQLYKTYNLNDLVSASDNCDDNPQVTGVWFNRTHHDKYNQLTGHQWTHSIDGSNYNCDRSYNGQSSRDQWSLLLDLIVGKTYVFTIGARQSQCSPFLQGERKRSVGVGGIKVYTSEHGTTAAKQVNPPPYNFEFKTYEVYFTARQVTTDITLWSDQGIVWSVPIIEEFMINAGAGASGGGQAAVSLVSHVGAGIWQEVPHSGQNLQCENMEQITDLVAACGEIIVSSNSGQEIFRALPVIIDDRYTYQSTTRNWVSVEHVRLNLATGDEVWWIICFFAQANPNAYAWISVEAEIAKVLRRNPDASATEIWQSLRSTNTIETAWKEVRRGSPEEIGGSSPMIGTQVGIDCPSNAQITDGQCQGACYYDGYGFSIQYSLLDRTRSAQCWCGTDCHTRSGLSLLGAVYTYWKWYEGFFYDDSTKQVWILAYTDTDDLKINMWVQFADQCGNIGVGKVEFWVAPSLESAAAQGRTCDEADTDMIGYQGSIFSFSSDNVIAPSAVQADAGNAIQGNVDAAFEGWSEAGIYANQLPPDLPSDVGGL